MNPPQTDRSRVDQAPAAAAVQVADRGGRTSDNPRRAALPGQEGDLPERFRPWRTVALRSYRWTAPASSITELAAAEKINRSYLCRVLRLTLLAPEIVEAILDGRQPDDLTLPALMKGFPVKWDR